MDEPRAQVDASRLNIAWAMIDRTRTRTRTTVGVNRCESLHAKM
jgi:hypothetical protein